MSLVVESNFQHILRMLNTNIDGRQKVMYALTAIRGVGRRFSNIVLKKADIDLTKRYAMLCNRFSAFTFFLLYISWCFFLSSLFLAYFYPFSTYIALLFSYLLQFCIFLLIPYRAGQLTPEEIEKVQQILANPRQYNIPNWFLNRKKDIKDGKYLQAVSNVLDTKLREDLEMMKKMRMHRGLRHFWGLKVRGQHTKTTGRNGRTVGVAKTKAAQSK